MRTKIFAYKSILAAETDLEGGKFLNNPANDSEMGCVVPVNEIDIIWNLKQ